MFSWRYAFFWVLLTIIFGVSAISFFPLWSNTRNEMIPGFGASVRGKERADSRPQSWNGILGQKHNIRGILNNTRDGHAAAAFPIIKSRRRELLPNPLNRRPISRLCVLYVPNGKGYAKETLAFIESWLSIMREPLLEEVSRPRHHRLSRPDTVKTTGITTTPSSETDATVTNPTQETRMDTIDQSATIKGFQLEGERWVYPWLEEARREWDHMELAANPTIPLKTIDDSDQLAPVDGPPLVTDVFILTALDTDLKQFGHPACTIINHDNSFLDAATVDEMRATVNLTERVQEAEARLIKAFHDNPNWDKRPLLGRVKEARWGQSRCFYIRTSLLTERVGQPYNKHKPAHSISAILTPDIVKVVEDYDLVLRSDADCFLTPYFNHPNYIPWTLKSDTTKPNTLILPRPFWAGQGGYSGGEQNKILKHYAEFLGLRHQGFHSIGSTWYGTSTDVIKAATVSSVLTEFFLTYEPLFKTTVRGEWPHWFAGVITLYSGELAVNHLFNGSRLIRHTSLLDGGSTSNETMSLHPVIHIHCWHTAEFYSKFQAYPKTLVLDPRRKPVANSWYSYLHVAAAERFLDRTAQHRKKTSTTPVPVEHLVPEIFADVDKYFTCPKEYPHSFHSGRSCCAEAVDCNGAPLLHTSACCKDERQKPCHVSSGCYDTRQPRSPFDYLHPNVNEIRDRLRKRISKILEQLS